MYIILNETLKKDNPKRLGERTHSAAEKKFKPAKGKGFLGSFPCDPQGHGLFDSLFFLFGFAPGPAGV